MKSQLGLIVKFGSALMLAAPVAAQDFVLPPLIDNVGMGNIAIGAAAQAHAEQAFKKQQQNNVRGFTGDMPFTTTNPGANFDFSYSPSRARTQQNLRSFIAKTPDPAARANLEQMFATQPSLMDDINGAMRGYGFDPHNTADAYAAWWITVWGIANKQNIEPDAATVAAVKQQARNAFGATPDFAKTTDAQRQEYAEALLLQAAMLGSSFEQWKNDPNLINQLAEAARKGAKASGLDLSLMTLTQGGFVPRKGADASGVEEGEETALAATSAPATESISSSLGLALAAGAGLGVTLLGGLALMRRG